MEKQKKSSPFRTIISVLLMICIISLPQLTMVSNARKPVDSQPPTAPGSVTATSISQTSVTLSWTQSIDKKGVASYLIYKDTTYIGSTPNMNYTVTGLATSTTYFFTIKAKDYSGNISPASNVISVSVPSPTQSASPAVTVSPIPTNSPAPTIPPNNSTKVTVGYYASWSAYSGYTPLNIQASKLTHINYAFANIGDDLKIAVGDPGVDLSNFTKLADLKKTYPNLKSLISIGGWSWSGKFSDAALTDLSRTVFADSVVTFIKQYGFDGVDLDWEYPVGGGLSTNVSRPEDKTNFTLLLQKLREKLDAQGVIDGRKYLLSIAGGAGTFYASSIELNLIHNYIDYAILMTYDIHGSWDTYSDFNAPLYNPTESSPQIKWSVDSTVKLWLSKGFPASKIVVGVPFYGYVYNGITNSTNGLYKPFTSANAVSFDKILSTYLSNSTYIKYYHSDAKVPWLFNGSSFVSYDDAQSIIEKAKYITQNNLAGASIWELSQNKDGSLLNALYSNLK